MFVLLLYSFQRLSNLTPIKWSTIIKNIHYKAKKRPTLCFKKKYLQIKFDLMNSFKLTLLLCNLFYSILIRYLDQRQAI